MSALSRCAVLATALALAPAALHAQPVARPTVRPALAPAPRFVPPTPVRLALSNGLTVLLVESAAVPVAQVNLLVRGGSVADPAARPGLASLTADLMDEGAGRRSALELADAVEFLGVSLSTGSTLHGLSVQLSAPTSKLDAALDLMADVALRPAFATAELDRLRARRLTALAQRRDQAGAIASVLYDRTLFGPDHPYGRGALGNAASLGALTQGEIAGFHRGLVRPENAALVVVGDVRQADIVSRLEARFGQAAWPSGAPGGIAVVPVAEARQVTGRTIYLVDKPGAAQSVIRIGRIGAARSTPDYYALQVLNTILGGSFTSRLNQNLRETHGYAYGAGSSFDLRPVAGPFTARSDVQTNATAPALTEFVKELTGIREPVPTEEFEKARSYVALSFPSPFESVSGTAQMIGDLWINGLPLDTYARFTERILAVTPADVQRVARQYVDPTRSAFIVVGDRAQIEAPVRALGLGTVRVLTIDDVLGPAGR